MSGILLSTGADLNNKELVNALLEASTTLDTAKQFGYNTTREELAWRTTGNTAKTIRDVTLDKFAAPVADVSLAGYKLTNVANPVADTDAANKGYVDALVTGLDPKQSVRAATTAALPAVTYNNGTGGVGATLTSDANGALPDQDDVTLVVGNRLLVRNQAATLQNGIYQVTQVGDGSNPFILTRTADADDSPDGEVTAGMFTFVEEGTLYGDTGWVLSTNNPITIGTTGLVFTQFSAAGTINAGAGLQQSGTTINVTQTGTTLTIGADTVDVRLATNGGLEDSSGVKVKADTTGGANLAKAVNLSGNGVAIKVDDTTIEGDATTGQLKVKDLGISTAKLAATSVTAAKLGSDVAGSGLTGGNGSAIDVNAGNGITISSDAVTVAADTTGGANLARAINVSANGVAVKIDDTTIAENASQRLSVKKTIIPMFKEFTSVGGSSTEVFTHNLNNKNLQVLARKISTDKQVIVDVSYTTVNTITVDFGVDPSTDYVVMVNGLDKN